MITRTGLAVAAAAGLLAVTSAGAQTSPPAATPSIPEKQGAPMSGQSDNLSKKLSKSGGVIAPKDNVDPGISAPAPDPTPHATPVIPPSSTGGDTAK